METFSYKVGDHRYTNKLQAVKANIETGFPILFETPYGDTDFSIEPEESLEALVVEHMKRLRDRYRWIKLYYSGGSDSHLLLHYFVKHKVHIDEIVCLKNGIPGTDTEIEQFAEPTLKKLRHDLFKTKITVKTLSLNDYFDYYSQGISERAIELGCAGTHTYFRLHWNLDIYGKEKSHDVVNVRGQEKPKILKHGSDYYTYNLDLDLEPHVNSYQFFSVDPTIQSKQCHMYLRSLLKTGDDGTLEHSSWLDTIGTPISSHDLPTKTRYHGKDANFVKWKDKKFYYLNDKDRIAIDWCAKNQPTLLMMWHENLEQLKKITKNTWWNHGRPELNSTGVLSEFRCLTKNEVKSVDDLFPNGFKI